MVNEKMKELLTNGSFDSHLKRVYVDDSSVAIQKERYAKLADLFCSEYGDAEKLCYYSAPGRTEVCGNHTDHNNGKVLAAAINLDAVAAVVKRDGNITRVKSVGYPLDTVDISDMSIHAERFGTSVELIRGMYAGFIERGYKVGAFDAYTVSSVLSGSGLSSSAAFEVLIGTILNYLFNEGKVSAVEIAQIAQYAENKYFNKPCGLMDQMASSVGGFVEIDFKDVANPIINSIDFDFASCNHSLCIVDTGGSHADLTNEYGAVRSEMESVAACFGKKVLREINENDFYSKVSEVRSKVGDRAVVRAMHFYGDNNRVEDESAALKNGDFEKFKNLVISSGRSSFMYNQNVYATIDSKTQPLSVALCVAERILNGKGAWRVHGGGFAGTMQAFVPNDLLEEYLKEMKSIFGEKSCYVLSIRPCGGVEVIGG